MNERQSRSYDFTIARADSGDDGLTLEGYAAVFDTPTTINDFLGEYTETIARGAFSRTINARMPVLQFDHGTHPLIGSIPLGAIRKLAEDDLGLFVRARLSDNWLIQPVRDAIMDGAVDGMSFQFSVTQDDWNEDRDARVIREVKLYELGPVVYPAYETTTVGVRSEIAGVLSCEDLRTDLARAITFASPEPASRTSDEDTDNPADPPLVVPDRQAAKAALKIAAVAAMPSDYLKENHNE